ncbi:hypothetical protein AVEN_69565-1 [Araneus ventricosus]|uniref:Uncharacterized protein n=1 Tax=Araneus ventricosus TaxID=182803 RepID=A0A4Y2NRT7_ARAVE|nr:hypothetical protein AVEN_69565-1 [Araneus ventricosus]
MTDLRLGIHDRSTPKPIVNMKIRSELEWKVGYPMVRISIALYGLPGYKSTPAGISICVWGERLEVCDSKRKSEKAGVRSRRLE